MLSWATASEAGPAAPTRLATAAPRTRCFRRIAFSPLHGRRLMRRLLTFRPLQRREGEPRPGVGPGGEVARVCTVSTGKATVVSAAPLVQEKSNDINDIHWMSRTVRPGRFGTKGNQMHRSGTKITGKSQDTFSARSPSLSPVGKVNLEAPVVA